MEQEELIRAIGEPMRLRILELLTRRQYCVRSLARMLGISEPAVSQHLPGDAGGGLVNVESWDITATTVWCPRLWNSWANSSCSWRRLPEGSHGGDWAWLRTAAHAGSGDGRTWLPQEMPRAWPGGASPSRGVRLSGHGRRNIAPTGSAASRT